MFLYIFSFFLNILPVLIFSTNFVHFIFPTSSFSIKFFRPPFSVAMETHAGHQWPVVSYINGFVSISTNNL